MLHNEDDSLVFSYTPTYRGFKTFYGYYMGRGDYFDHRNKEAPKGWQEWWGLDWHYDVEGQLNDVYSDFGEYSSRVIANRASDLIQNHNFEAKPLFLYLPFQSVHSANNVEPLEVPTDTLNQFQVSCRPILAIDFVSCELRALAHKEYQNGQEKQ